MNISFGSNYFIKQKSDFPFRVLDDIFYGTNFEAQESQEFYPSKQSCETGIFSEIIINSPDKYDDFIESILMQNNVRYNKVTISEALDLDSISSRMIVEPDCEESYMLVEMDVSKLDKYLKEDGVSYIEPNGANGIGDRYNQAYEFFKTGKEIHAPRLSLRNIGSQLYISIQDGRHRFARLRDMGMEKIPVAIPNETLSIAEKFELLYSK